MASDLSNDLSKLSMSSSYTTNSFQRTNKHVPSPHSIEEFPDESSLFVGDLSRSVTEETLQNKFAAFGDVEAVDIKRDKVTKNNLGYGFVKFRTRQQAEHAKLKLHGAEIGGRNIRIGWAQKNTNLFVGDLDGRITSTQLQEIFRQFGPIYEEDTFVKKNKYGFVKFKYRAHAERAKQELDGQPLTIPNTEEVTDRPIRIGWGDANTQRNCVHVQFDASAAEIHNLQEEDFRKHFAPYGHVLKVSLPRYADRRLKGYGFIHFQENDDGEESAARAITTLSGEELNGVTIQCNFGKRQNNRHKRHPKAGGSPPRFDELGQFQMHMNMNAPAPFPMYGAPYGPYTGFPPGGQPPPMMMGHPFGAMMPDGRGGVDLSQMSPSFRGVAPPPHPGPRLGPPPSLGGASLQNGMAFAQPQAFPLSPDPNARMRQFPPSPSPSVPSPLFAAQGFAPTAYDNESVLPPAMIPSAGNLQPMMVGRASPPMMPTIPLPATIGNFGHIPTAMPVPAPALNQPSISPLFVGAIPPPTQVSPTLGPRPAFAAARQG